MASKSYKAILIATDGKDVTKNAIDHGIEQAKNSGAKLHALYVIDTVEFASTPMDASWEERQRELKQEGDKATKYVVKRAQEEGLEVERLISVIVEGRPADEIIKYTEKYSIDLIVIGISEKGWLERFLQGSVSDKIVRKSKIPVLAVRGILKHRIASNNMV